MAHDAGLSTDTGLRSALASVTPTPHIIPTVSDAPTLLRLSRVQLCHLTSLQDLFPLPGAQSLQTPGPQLSLLALALAAVQGGVFGGLQD